MLSTEAESSRTWYSDQKGMKPTHESRYLEVAAFAGAVFKAVVPYRKRSPLKGPYQLWQGRSSRLFVKVSLSSVLR